ncbi:hypothetical protein D0Y65_022564 [Glycine soja]|uniref:Uncharacterized protein n=1 Tax=Glycine soja TaxID=3848 RepID=A0A445JP76_GLYSO|nr:hypothetical protein D0Y65_022564 [Glycine soja]
MTNIYLPSATWACSVKEGGVRLSSRSRTESRTACPPALREKASLWRWPFQACPAVPKIQGISNADAVNCGLWIVKDHTLYNTKPRENTFQQEKIRHKSLKRGAMLEHFQHQMPVHKSPKDELQMNKIVKPRKAYLVVDQ